MSSPGWRRRPAGTPLRHRRRARAGQRPAGHRPPRRRAAGAGAEHLPATLAELVFGVTHEGAADVDDLLDRRTRIGLVAEDRAPAVPLARRALELVAGGRQRPVIHPDSKIRGRLRRNLGQDETCGSAHGAPLADPMRQGAPSPFRTGSRPCRAGQSGHSTVTDFARLRGLSMSWPRAGAAWYARSCSGTGEQDRVELRLVVRYDDPSARAVRQVDALVRHGDSGRCGP